MTRTARPHENWVGAPLSPSQRRVVVELARDGPTNKVIADRLNITEQTVKFHVADAMMRSTTNTRTALALWWIRCGQYKDNVG